MNINPMLEWLKMEPVLLIFASQTETVAAVIMCLREIVSVSAPLLSARFARQSCMPVRRLLPNSGEHVYLSDGECLLLEGEQLQKECTRIMLMSPHTL